MGCEVMGKSGTSHAEPPPKDPRQAGSVVGVTNLAGAGLRSIARNN